MSDVKLGVDARPAKAGVDEFERQLDRANRAVNKTSKEIEKTDKAVDSASGSFKDAAQAVSSMGGPLGTVGSKLNTVSSGISKTGLALGAFAAATAVATGAMVKAVNVFADAERQQLRLEGVIKATGGTAGKTATEIERLSREIGKATLASTSEVRDAAAQLLTFNKVVGDTFDRTLKASQDLAELGFGSISSASVQLGKALQDPKVGLSALTEVGVSFTNQQKEQIKTLTESGKVLEAQNIILEAIEAQAGGTAEAVAGGLAGAFDTVSEEATRFFEIMGGSGSSLLSATRALGEAVGWLADKYALLTGQFEKLSQAGAKAELQSLSAQRKQVLQEIDELDKNGAGLFATVLAGGDSQVAKNKAVVELRTQLGLIEMDIKNISKAALPAQGPNVPLKIAPSGPTDKQIKDAERARKELEKTLETRRKHRMELTIEREQLGRLIEAAKESEVVQKKVQNQIKAENELRRLGIDINSRQGQAIAAEIIQREELVDAFKSEVKARDDLEKAAEREVKRREKEAQELEKALLRPFENAADNIQRLFVDTFEDIFTGGVKSFGDLARTALSIFTRLAAESAALQFFGPQGLNAKSLAGGGGIGGAFNSAGGLLSSGLSLGKDLLLNPVDGLKFLSNTSQMAGVNIAGKLGLGSAGASAFGTIGAALPGAGIGSLGAKLLGFEGTGNAFADTGLSVGGAVLGNLLLPGVGGVLGGFAGQALGSAFGNKPSSKLQLGAVDLASGQSTLTDGLTGSKFSQGNADLRDAVLGVGSQVAQLLAEATGEEIEKQLRVDIGGRGLGFAVSNDPRNASLTGAGSTESLVEGVVTSIVAEFDAIPEDIKAGLDTIDYSNLETALKQIETAIVEPLKKQAAGRALTENSLTAVLQKQQPLVLAISQEIETYYANLKQATELEVDAGNIERLHRLNMIDLQNQFNATELEGGTSRLSRLQEENKVAESLVNQFSSLAENLGQTIEDIRFGAGSPLSQGDKLSESLGKLRSAGQRAALGDPDAIAEVDRLAKVVVAANDEFYGTTGKGAEIFSEVESILRASQVTATRQITVQQQIVDQTAQEIAALDTNFTQQNNVLTMGFEGVVSALSRGIQGGAGAVSAAGSLSGLSLPSNAAELARQGNSAPPGSTRASLYGQAGQSAVVASRPDVQAAIAAGALTSESWWRDFGLKGYQFGGRTEPGRAFVAGEAGPEVVLPMGRASQVIPNGQLSMLGDNGETSETIRREGTQSRRMQAESSVMIANAIIALGEDIGSLRKEIQRLQAA